MEAETPLLFSTTQLVPLFAHITCQPPIPVAAQGIPGCSCRGQVKKERYGNLLWFWEFRERPTRVCPWSRFPPEKMIFFEKSERRGKGPRIATAKLRAQFMAYGNSREAWRKEIQYLLELKNIIAVWRNRKREITSTYHKMSGKRKSSTKIQLESEGQKIEEPREKKSSLLKSGTEKRSGLCEEHKNRIEPPPRVPPWKKLQMCNSAPPHTPLTERNETTARDLARTHRTYLQEIYLTRRPTKKRKAEEEQKIILVRR